MGGGKRQPVKGFRRRLASSFASQNESTSLSAVPTNKLATLFCHLNCAELSAGTEDPSTPTRHIPGYTVPIEETLQPERLVNVTTLLKIPGSDVRVEKEGSLYEAWHH